MPLSPLPPENTPRLFIKYTTRGIGHIMVVRLPIGGTSADAVARYNAALTALRGQLPTTDSVLGADFSAAGSNVRFPLAVSGGVGTSSYTASDKDRPIQVTATGRSLDGRKVRIGMFSPAYRPDTYGYRITGLSGPGAGIWSLLTGSSLDARSISGGTVQWNNYINIGLNDHWVADARSNT